MARNRYNQYAQPYLPPQSGASYAYQPQFDPANQAMLIEGLDRSQKRYDVGREKFSEFAGAAGSIDTYDPNALQERVSGFTDRVQKMVDQDYNGDFGQAANDINDMIAEERGQTFYKANKFQQEQAKLQQAAQNQERGLGENLIIQNNAMQANLQEAIDSGNYQEALRYQGIEAPNYDKLAGDLVGKVKADSFAGLTDLDANERKLIADAIGEGNLEGFLANERYSGTRSKLLKNKDGIVDALSNSFLEQASEPLYAQAQMENPNATPEQIDELVKAEARNHISNKIPQLMSSNYGRTGQRNLKPKTETPESDLYGFPLTFTSNTTSNRSHQKHVEDIYGKDKINLNADYKATETDAELTRKYNTQKSIAESDKYSSQQRAEAARKMEKLEKEGALNAQRHAQGLQKISDWEKNYNFPNHIDTNDNQAKLAFVAELDDKFETKNAQAISLYSFNESKDFLPAINKQLQEGKIQSPMVMRDGEWHNVSNSDDINIEGSFWDVNKADFNATGISQEDGALLAEHKDKKKGKIKYYPSYEAEVFGKQIQSANGDLKDNGYVVENTFGKPTLTLKNYNSGNPNTNTPGGAYNLTTIEVPPGYEEMAKAVSSHEEALRLARLFSSAGIRGRERKEYLLNHIYNNSEQLGYLTQRKE